MTLNIKDINQFVVISDNVVDCSLEKENFSQHNDSFNNSGKTLLNEEKILPQKEDRQHKNLVNYTKDEVSDQNLYKKFIHDQLYNKKNEK